MIWLLKTREKAITDGAKKSLYIFERLDGFN